MCGTGWTWTGRLYLKYVPVVSQVLPGKKAATFFQLDRRLNVIIDLQLFYQIPLAHVRDGVNVAFQCERTPNLLPISPFRLTCPTPLPSSIGRSTRSIAG